MTMSSAEILSPVVHQANEGYESPSCSDIPPGPPPALLQCYSNPGPSQHAQLMVEISRPRTPPKLQFPVTREHQTGMSEFTPPRSPPNKLETSFHDSALQSSLTWEVPDITQELNYREQQEEYSPEYSNSASNNASPWRSIPEVIYSSRCKDEPVISTCALGGSGSSLPETPTFDDYLVYDADQTCPSIDFSDMWNSAASKMFSSQSDRTYLHPANQLQPRNWGWLGFSRFSRIAHFWSGTFITLSFCLDSI